MDLNGYLGDLCSVSVCLVFDGFLEMIFQIQQEKRPTSPKPPEDDSQLRSQTHVGLSLTTLHGRFWESFGRRVFEKKQKGLLKIHGGGLVKLIVDLNIP